MTAYGVPQTGPPLLTAGYTGEGMRAWKESSNSSRTYYLYDGTNNIAELSGTGTLNVFYTWGANGLISKRAGTASSFFTYDPVGSVSTVTNGAGTVQGDEAFDATGMRVNGYTSRPVDFCGQWGYHFDDETGLLLCGHRYYDPYTARFLNRDPIRYKGGPNLYQYVGNDAPNAIDPSGFFLPNPVPTSLPIPTAPPSGPVDIFPIPLPVAIGGCLLFCFPTPTADPCQDQIDSCGPAPSPTPDCEDQTVCYLVNVVPLGEGAGVACIYHCYTRDGGGFSTIRKADFSMDCDPIVFGEPQEAARIIPFRMIQLVQIIRMNPIRVIRQQTLIHIIRRVISNSIREYP